VWAAAGRHRLRSTAPCLTADPDSSIQYSATSLGWEKLVEPWDSSVTIKEYLPSVGTRKERLAARCGFPASVVLGENDLRCSPNSAQNRESGVVPLIHARIASSPGCSHTPHSTASPSFHCPIEAKEDLWSFLGSAK